jgi:glycosyltransferase involved in cell wall biosynthesis
LRAHRRNGYFKDAMLERIPQLWPDPLAADKVAQGRVSMVVPTRNRAHTLRLVAPSYYLQDGVDEIVFVDDGGSDGTPGLLAELAARHPAVRTAVLRNESRQGASACRNQGAAVVRNNHILFCDDDEMLEPGYARTCLAKLTATGAAAVSGRRVYMLDGETPEEALRRFGSGMRRAPPFRPWLCEYVNGARFEGDVELPFTNAVILTPTALVRRYGFDPRYAQGNGYREETDYQMNLFVNGHRIIATNDTHSIHLSPSQVRTGGQRVPVTDRIRWSVHYTGYFYQKYWVRYAARMGVRLPRQVALGCFAAFQVYRELLRPTLHRIAMAHLTARNRRRRAAERAQLGLARP